MAFRQNHVFSENLDAVLTREICTGKCRQIRMFGQFALSSQSDLLNHSKQIASPLLGPLVIRSLKCIGVILLFPQLL